MSSISKSRRPETLEEIRRLGVAAISRGERVNAVASSFAVHPASVSRWLTRFRRGGDAGLSRRKATGRPRKLDGDLFGEAVLSIVRCLATDFGFENPLWTCRRLQTVIGRVLKVRLSIPTVWRHLRRAKLTCQKPERRAFEQNPIAREEWLRKGWPAIKALAKKERALIFFQDESSIRLTPTVGRTWAPSGDRPTVPLTGKRGSICVMSAVSPSGHLYFMIPGERVNSDVYILFLAGLMKEYPRRKIFVIADQASPHTSKRTKIFLEHNRRLRQFVLPPYSPDFNPDEQVWNHLKHHELKAHNETEKDGLRRRTSRAMRKMGKRPSLLRSFFHRSKIREHFLDLL